MKLTTLVAGALAVLLFANNAQAILIDRGNGLIYDSVNNISWIKDADVSGFNTWVNQVAWAAAFSLAGFDDFRLPTSAELASLYDQLPGGPDKTGDIAPFEDIQNLYWSSSEAGSFASAVFFNTDLTIVTPKTTSLVGWAVRAGDSAIPEPASILLLGAGLGALLGVRRLRR